MADIKRTAKIDTLLYSVRDDQGYWIGTVAWTPRGHDWAPQTFDLRHPMLHYPTFDEAVAAVVAAHEGVQDDHRYHL